MRGATTAAVLLALSGINWCLGNRLVSLEERLARERIQLEVTAARLQSALGVPAEQRVSISHNGRKYPSVEDIAHKHKDDGLSKAAFSDEEMQRQLDAILAALAQPPYTQQQQRQAAASQERKLLQTCTTTDGTACMLPFTYAGDTYNYCTDVGYDTYWCYTDSSDNWGTCDMSVCTLPTPCTTQYDPIHGRRFAWPETAAGETASVMCGGGASDVGHATRVCSADGVWQDAVLPAGCTDPPAYLVGSDSCLSHNNGLCEDGSGDSVNSLCDAGTDCTDCSNCYSTSVEQYKCLDTCPTSDNGVCEDSGVYSSSSTCNWGTDCADCGSRPLYVQPFPEAVDGCEDDCAAFFNILEPYDYATRADDAFSDDDDCDDGGPNSDYSVCPVGHDCADCGVRAACDNSCRFAYDSTCQEGTSCKFGTDSYDCRADTCAVSNAACRPRVHSDYPVEAADIIRTELVSSVSECCDLCSSTPECFVWKVPDATVTTPTCHLLHQRYTGSTFVSYTVNAVWGTVPDVRNSCRYPFDGACDEIQYCFPGTDSADCRPDEPPSRSRACLLSSDRRWDYADKFALDTMSDVSDAEECCAVCTRNSQCATWVVQNGECTLISRGSHQMSLTVAPGVVSGQSSAHSALCDNTCQYANDGVCDEPTYCSWGTDSSDCRSECATCTDTCMVSSANAAANGVCEEGTDDECPVGSDCTDCGPSERFLCVSGNAVAWSKVCDGKTDCDDDDDFWSDERHYQCPTLPPTASSTPSLAHTQPSTQSPTTAVDTHTETPHATQFPTTAPHTAVATTHSPTTAPVTALDSEPSTQSPTTEPATHSPTVTATVPVTVLESEHATLASTVSPTTSPTHTPTLLATAAYSRGVTVDASVPPTAAPSTAVSTDPISDVPTATPRPSATQNPILARLSPLCAEHLSALVDSLSFDKARKAFYTANQACNDHGQYLEKDCKDGLQEYSDVCEATSADGLMCAVRVDFDVLSLPSKAMVYECVPASCHSIDDVNVWTEFLASQFDYCAVYGVEQGQPQFSDCQYTSTCNFQPPTTSRPTEDGSVFNSAVAHTVWWSWCCAMLAMAVVM